jgi:hypothetical protein
MSKESIDVLFSFDTTGSMYPCLTQVRRYVTDTVKLLFKEIPNLRVGIITHGDYCDDKKVLTSLDLTSDEKKICDFIKSAPATGGGDSAECYELVLNEARNFSWTSGKNKAFVLIGDDVPHDVGYRYGSFTNKLDWKNELGLLVEAGINVYPVQALNRRHANFFYDGVAAKAGVDKISLDQFSDINDLILSICFKRANKEDRLEEIIKTRSIRFNRDFNTSLSGKKVKRSRDKNAVNPSRFQVLYVDKDCDIKRFVQENGLNFKKGRGFYEFTKTVKVQSYKEVVLKDAAGNMFSGDFARSKVGIPIGEDAKVRPVTGDQCFIQSTSVNRKLLKGTHFLYEIEDWSD